VPAGRYPKSFGYDYVGGFSYTISISSIRRHRKRDADALMRAQIKGFRRDLRLAFWIYQTDHKTPHSTRTTQSRFLGRVTTSAQRFLTNPNRQWANRLLRSINEGSDDDRKELYSALDGVPGAAKVLGAHSMDARGGGRA
jgi:hypothetical protein